MGGRAWGIKVGDGECSSLHGHCNLADSMSRDGIAPYFNKHQILDESDDLHPDPQFMPFAAKDKYHGTEGPIHTSFNDYYEVSTAPFTFWSRH